MLGSRHTIEIKTFNPHNDPAVVSTVTVPDDLTEDQALAIYHELRRRFDWAGTFFTRDDATLMAENETLTDAGWDAVCNTYEWRKGITDALTEYGWGVVTDAINAATENKES